MPDVSFTNLLLVAAVAVLAPLTVGFAPRLRVPAVVLEIIGGIIIGPSVLGWAHVDLPVSILALFGLAFLLFLAGLEIDVHRLRGRLLRFAVLGYLVTLVLAYGAGASFTALGWVSQPLLLAIALSATSLGLVVPVLKDAGQVHSRLGQTALAAASVADFSAIVLLSLFFSSSGGSTGSKVVVLGAFAGLVAVTGLVVSGVARSMRLGRVLVRLQDTTAEIRVRFAVLLLVAFTALAERFGLESILGAFLAGAIVGLVDRDSSSHPNFRVKLDAIGYGFLVPVFFVSSGIRLDLTGLLHSPSALVRVPVFLLALLVVRGLPALLGLRTNGTKSTLALGLLQATSLPFLVTVTQIGVVLGKLTSVTAAALVCAGLLSVLIFPLIALGLLRGNEPAPAPVAPAPAVPQPVPEPRLMLIGPRPPPRGLWKWRNRPRRAAGRHEGKPLRSGSTTGSARRSPCRRVACARVHLHCHGSAGRCERSHPCRVVLAVRLRRGGRGQSDHPVARRRASSRPEGARAAVRLSAVTAKGGFNPLKVQVGVEVPGRGFGRMRGWRVC